MNHSEKIDSRLVKSQNLRQTAMQILSESYKDELAAFSHIPNLVQQLEQGGLRAVAGDVFFRPSIQKLKARRKTLHHKRDGGHPKNKYINFGKFAVPGHSSRNEI